MKSVDWFLYLAYIDWLYDIVRRLTYHKLYLKTVPPDLL